MATSSMAIDTTNITDLVDKAANDPTAVDDNFDEIVEAFNDFAETTTGHFHDGTDSKPVYAGASGWTAEAVLVGICAHVFSGGTL